MAHTGTPCVSHWLDRPRPHAVRLPQTNNAGPAAAVISAGIAACPRVSSSAAKKSPAPAGNTRSSHALAAVSTSASVVASGIVIAGSFPNRAATFAVVDGCCGSRAKSVSCSGVSPIQYSPPRMVRPRDGLAGTNTARTRAVISSNTPSSAAMFPRNAESVFLKMNSGEAALIRRVNFRSPAAAASGSSRRVSVSRQITCASVRGCNSVCTSAVSPCANAIPANSAAPERSSAKTRIMYQLKALEGLRLFYPEIVTRHFVAVANK